MDAGRNAELQQAHVKPAVAAFVKTPGLSPLKTRLAAVLGTEAAERGYRLTAACVAETLLTSRLPAYWAVAEDDGRDDPLWAGLPRLSQGTGPLGARMSAVHDELVRRHGAGILVGADLPQIGVADLGTAAAWLSRSGTRHVIGPARDGGFWLYGGNRSTPLPAWLAVRYSRPDTARCFVRAIGPGRWRRLPRRTDLDVADDLAAVRSELVAAGVQGDARRRLADWLAASRAHITGSPDAAGLG